MGPLTLLLVSEIGGRAFPIARIGDAELVAGAARSVVKAKRETARQVEAESPELARRFSREATEIEGICCTRKPLR